MIQTQLPQPVEKIVGEVKKTVSRGKMLNVALINLVQRFDVASRKKVLGALSEAEAIVDTISKANKLSERIRLFEKGGFPGC